MIKHTLPDNSYITLSVDDNSKEIIIENIKSNTKGNGSILVDWAIDYARTEGYFAKDYNMTLYAYPQDATIDNYGLHQFWLAMDFVDDAEQGGEGYLMHLA
jgi:hypothetical protein